MGGEGRRQEGEVREGGEGRSKMREERGGVR